MPSLLATGAVHQALAERKLRSRTSLVVVADDVRDVHALSPRLLGYGADAVCPRLALDTVAGEADDRGRRRRHRVPRRRTASRPRSRPAC